MSQVNPLPQQPGEPETSLEATLGRYKATLENLLKRLLSDEDLRTITKGAIDQFERDLRAIVGGVEYLREKPERTKYFVSIDAVQVKVQEVIDNLYVASDVLERGDSAKDRKELFYPSLRACPPLLREAIKQFKPLTKGASDGK